MERWEQIIKDKLEAYESPLPAGGFARLSEAHAVKAAASRRFRLALGFTTAAVAAGLALFLLLKGPEETKENPTLQEEAIAQVQPAPQVSPSLPVPSAPQMPPTQRVVPRPVKTPNAAMEPVKSTAEVSVTEAPSIAENLSTANPAPENQASAPAIEIGPEPKTRASRTLHIGTKDRKIAGVGTAGLLATSLLANHLQTIQSGLSGEPVDSAPHEGPDYPGTKPTTPPRHFFPFRAGLSVGYPISERTRITSGLDYSLYSSQIEVYAENQYKWVTQKVHYLGIPFRVDLSILSGNRYDIYIGGGLEAELCLAGTVDGRRVYGCDGIEFSLLGAAGAQWMMTKHAGLYLEPTLSWLPLADDIIPKTYRTEHPVMFSVIFGIRFMIDK